MSRTGKPSTTLLAVRESTPLVQCITNTVVTNFTANVLLSLGASPAMVDIPTEAGEFARIASALLVNLGTPHAEQRAAMLEAAAAATAAGTPWVLDPVAVGGLSVRTALAHELLELRPTVIRGNASEIRALAGAGGGGRGVDAVEEVSVAASSARALALRVGGVVAVSGAVDLVTDGTAEVRVSGGDALLTRVTGGGCALGAVVAAFVAAGRGAGVGVLEAVVAAHAVYAAAAEQAAETAERAAAVQAAGAAVPAQARAAGAAVAVHAVHAAAETAVPAHAVCSATAEQAAERAVPAQAGASVAAHAAASERRPGSFAVAFVDALSAVGAAEVDAVGVSASAGTATSAGATR